MGHFSERSSGNFPEIVEPENTLENSPEIQDVFLLEIQRYSLKTYFSLV